MKKLKKIFPFFITILIFFIIFHSLNYQEVLDIIKSANKKLLIASLIILFSTPLILAQRWNTLLLAHDVKIGYRKILKLFLASTPLSKISPSNSGDLMRAVLLKNKLSLSNNIGIIVLENLLDVLSLSLLVFIGSLALRNIYLTTASLLLLTIIILFIIYGPKVRIRNNKWKYRIDSFFLAKRTILKNPKLIIILFLYSITPWLMVVICIKLLFLAFSADLSILTILVNQPITIFAGLLPLTFSGIGVRESAMLYFYSGLADKSIVLTVGLTYSIGSAFFLPIICLPFLFSSLKNKKYY